MARLDANGRGILLLHDIHPATALALPSLLNELKQRGYHVVHVVPAGDMPKSVPELPSPAAANGTWPRVLQTGATTDGTPAAMSHHPVKKGVSGKVHYLTDECVTNVEPASPDITNVSPAPCRAS